MLVVRIPLVGMFSDPPYILSSRSGVRPNMKVGRILERRLGALDWDWNWSPESQTIKLMIEMIVEAQQTVPGSPHIHHQASSPGFLGARYEETGDENIRLMDNGHLTILPVLGPPFKFSSQRKSLKVLLKNWFVLIGWWESHVLDFLRSFKPKQTMKL